MSLTVNHRHIFHTRHDFSPGLGWAAFQLIASVAENGIYEQELGEVAKLIASPLAVRSDLTKLLAGLEEVGLIMREGELLKLSSVGQALAEGHGLYADEFVKAVHCLYVWQWLWMTSTEIATPSWSYRETCRLLLKAGSIGLDRDDLVLRIIASAQMFGAEKVSFSRSSISGITMWLEAQRPALAHRVRSNSIAFANCLPTIGTLRLHLAALCRLHHGEARLDGEGIQLLAEALLTVPSALTLPLNELSEAGDEFLAVSGSVPRVIFRYTDDPLLRWGATGKI